MMHHDLANHALLFTPANASRSPFKFNVALEITAPLTNFSEVHAVDQWCS
eukprot:m.451999 g.451999  ORF g.451999 m.451999 type:complete len:50 (-) comp178724_c0_seq1:69-218(-)